MHVDVGRLEHLNVVLKISERCNLACDYCYFFFNNDQSWKEHPPLINLRTVKKLADFLKAASSDFGLRETRVVLHGGEPLMMKPAMFEKLCETLREAEGPDYRLDITLQTNGVLITDEWISVFERHRIGVGISLDGDRQINDQHRFDKRGRSSYDGVVRGLKLLQNAASEGRISSPGLLAVAQPEGDGRKIYHHFTAELGVKYVDFLLPDYTHDDLPPGAIEGVEAFMGDALKSWLKDGASGVKVRSFSEILCALLGDSAADKARVYKNDYRHMISVSSNGDIGPEDTLKILAPEFVATGLNVSRNTLRDVISHPVWQRQAEASTNEPAACRDCVWKKVCRSGRPVNRYARDNGFDNPSVFCTSLKRLHAEACAFLVDSGTPIEAIERRLGLAAPESSEARA